jgi:hypothetical protein
MSRSKTYLLSAVTAVLLFTSPTSFAQDTTAARQAAADKYLKAVPMAKMLDDTFAEMSKQMPVEQRSQFRSDMKKVVRVDFLENLSRESMVKTFTTDELNALADFYGSKHGASAMLKFGTYMGHVMPAIQAEVQRSIQQVQQQKQQQQPQQSPS